jgi:hemolysin activation/secretion protein
LLHGSASLLVLQPAQAQPSAGSLLQGIESQKPPFVIPTPEPQMPRPPPASVPTSKQSFSVKQFKFVGNKQITEQELLKLAQPYLNRAITYEQLKSVTDAVAELYLNKSLLVRVLLPKQDITNGVVTIQVIEAMLGGVIIENQSKRIQDERVVAWVYNTVPQATLLRLDALDRALRTLNDQPDLTVASSFKEGKKTGETILYLTVKDKALIDAQVSVDNFGDPATGNTRATVNLNVNGPFGRGEQFSVFGLKTQGSSYGRLGATAPVGASGLRLGVNASFMSYRVIDPDFSNLNVKGQAATVGLEATYPIYRTAAANTYLTGNLNRNDFLNTNVFGINSQYNTSVLQLGLGANRQDAWGGGGFTLAALNLSLGKVDLTNSPSQIADGLGPQVEGGFGKLRYSLNRQQLIAGKLSGYMSVGGQFANKNLDASEKLYVAGPYGVRAYGVGQGASTQAGQATVELRMDLPAQYQLTGFYDAALVQAWKSSNFDSAPESNYYALQGIGVGLNWFGPYGSQVKAVWARRTGSLSESVETTLNQNGGTSNNRYWLSGTLPF